MGHLVDEPLRPGGDGVLQRSHGARRERACEQAPEPCVLRRVLIEHHPLHEGEHVGGARVAYLGAAKVRRERAGVAQHPVHQLVGEHRPEAGPRLPAHQLGLRQPSEPAPRAAARRSGRAAPRPHTCAGRTAASGRGRRCRMGLRSSPSACHSALRRARRLGEHEEDHPETGHGRQQHERGDVAAGDVGDPAGDQRAEHGSDQHDRRADGP